MINQFDDTICAVSTPPGVGGIAVVRVSGPQAIDIVDRAWSGKRLTDADSHTAHLGTIIDTDRRPIDQAVATVYRTPRSFTGENVVELSVHGSTWIQQAVVNLLVALGCRVAEPGEFTRRAFAAGKLDLAEAEGVADLIASTSRAAHRLAMSQMRGGISRRLAELRNRLLELSSLLELELDFSEEDVEFASRTRLTDLANEILDEVSRLAGSFAAGSAIKNGVPVAIAGATNAGKSTLLNALLHDDRAIVSDIQGTTRDVIQDTLDIQGIMFRLSDTAGLRDTADPIEAMGIDRTLSHVESSSIILWVVDPTAPAASTIEAWLRISPRLSTSSRLIIAINKADRTQVTDPVSLLHTLLHPTPSPASDTQGTTLPNSLAPDARATTPSDNLISTPRPQNTTSAANLTDTPTISADYKHDTLQSPHNATTGNNLSPLTDAQSPLNATAGSNLSPLTDVRSPRNATAGSSLSPLTDVRSPRNATTTSSPIVPSIPDNAVYVIISSRTGQGIDQLESAMIEASGASTIAEADTVITNSRHYQALLNARESITRALEGLKTGLSGDFIAQDIRQTLHALSDITGQITTPEILQTIFSRFCVGK